MIHLSCSSSPAPPLRAAIHLHTLFSLTGKSGGGCGDQNTALGVRINIWSQGSAQAWPGLLQNQGQHLDLHHVLLNMGLRLDQVYYVGSFCAQEMTGFGTQCHGLVVKVVISHRLDFDLRGLFQT